MQRSRKVKFYDKLSISKNFKCYLHNSHDFIFNKKKTGIIPIFYNDLLKANSGLFFTNHLPMK